MYRQCKPAICAQFAAHVADRQGPTWLHMHTCMGEAMHAAMHLPNQPHHSAMAQSSLARRCFAPARWTCIGWPLQRAASRLATCSIFARLCVCVDAHQATLLDRACGQHPLGKGPVGAGFGAPNHAPPLRPLRAIVHLVQHALQVKLKASHVLAGFSPPFTLPPGPSGPSLQCCSRPRRSKRLFRACGPHSAHIDTPLGEPCLVRSHSSVPCILFCAASTRPRAMRHMHATIARARARCVWAH